eukprot:TRINITY_DN16647_c0_g1_i1.p1 TRINITY_DN16647_c0_g1~~TRINITY_DN16647_c0_g1_i1.p1  ORF type:complete len:588 (+),score=117.06 TRINITY_DN16647_c0_g1_i1:45-1808(+)
MRHTRSSGPAMQPWHLSAGRWFAAPALLVLASWCALRDPQQPQQLETPEPAGKDISNGTLLVFRPADPGPEVAELLGAHNEGAVVGSNGVSCSALPLRSLVMSGGGAKGVTHAGAIVALEEAGLLGGITDFAGSSAGAQAATMLAVGYSGRELVEILRGMDFLGLLDDSSSDAVQWMGPAARGVLPAPPRNIFADVSRLLSRFGWCRGETLRRRMDELITARTRKANTTFAELAAMRPGIRLRITAINVETGRLTFFDADSFPDMPVSLAVAASSSVPFLYVPVTWKGHRYVDGGFLRNLPTNAYSRGSGRGMLALALGPNRFKTPGKIQDFASFAARFFDGVLFGPDSANHEHNTNHSDPGLMHVVLDAGKVSAGDFHIGRAERAPLFVRGFVQTWRELAACGAAPAAAPVPEWLWQDSAAGRELPAPGGKGMAPLWERSAAEFAELARAMSECLPATDSVTGWLPVEVPRGCRLEWVVEDGVNDPGSYIHVHRADGQRRSVYTGHLLPLILVSVCGLLILSLKVWLLLRCRARRRDREARLREELGSARRRGDQLADRLRKAEAEIARLGRAPGAADNSPAQGDE